MRRRVERPNGELAWQRLRADSLALGAFLVLLAAVLTYRFINDDWLAEYDILSYFLPWYGHLGDRLRSFDIPGWMPWLSSGSPVAGDPSGGWWYLPVMLTFPLLAVTAAFKAMILLQAVIGGVAVYLFGRLLGLRPVAALLGTVAFVFGPFLAAQMMSGTVAGQASAWLPVALLGVERSLRASGALSRIAWWGLAGLAISQMAVSWPGQGLYNGLLIIAGWVAYRSLLWPVDPGRTIRGRLVDALLTGPAVLAMGLLLGAAGLLPRLQASSVSNIPNGDYTGVRGGDYLVTPHSFVTLLRDTLIDDAHFRPVALGTPVVVFALLAVLIGRRRYGIPFFAAIVVVAGVLSMADTPLHQALYLLPGFESLHTHSPRRLLWMCFIAPAMLAGAGLEAVLDWRPRRRVLPLLGVPFLMVIGAAWALDAGGIRIGWWPLILAGAATSLAGALAMAHRGEAGSRRLTIVRGFATALTITLVLLYPTARDVLNGRLGMADAADAEGCLRTYFSRTDAGGAGEYLQGQRRTEPPFRYVSYAGRDPAGRDPSYSARRCDPNVLAALAGARPVRLGLESIQGYNPLHLGVYVDYTDAMNGGAQDYHWMDPYPGALGGSPLLDMLNVRYIVVALAGPNGPTDVEALAPGRREVFRNGQVAVLENAQAFPRAWIVHEVRDNNDGEGLRQLAGGSVDGRQVAFVDGPLPPVAPVTAADAESEGVVITGDEEDVVTADVRAGAAGVVVFSDIYEAGWEASVDGEPVETLRVNHALRGVPVPAGEHAIELRYEPVSLRVGLWISLVTGAGLVIVWAAAIRQSLNQGGRASPGGEPGK